MGPQRPPRWYRRVPQASKEEASGWGGGGARRQRREPRQETEARPTLAFPTSPALPEACLNQGNDKRPACVISRQRRGPSGPGDFNTARCLRMFILILLIWSKQTNYVRF